MMIFIHRGGGKSPEKILPGGVTIEQRVRSRVVPIARVEDMGSSKNT
jgi:hypothetical protein